MRVAALMVVVVAISVSAVEANAAPAAGSTCKSFSASGLKYQWSVIGSVTCSQAKPWLLKLLAVQAKPSAKIVFTNGPKGFHCSAFADGKGRPSAGGCYTGTVAFPKNGFQWLG